MKNEDRIENHEVKPSPWEKIRKNPISLLRFFALSALIILPFCICLIVSYNFWLRAIGDGAYKYSDATYAQIETAIQSSALEDIGLDSLHLQKALQNVSPENPELYVLRLQEILQNIASENNLDAETMQKSLLDIQQIIKQYETEQNSDPSQVKYISTYENNQVELVCSVKDGFFLGEVTAILTNNYKIVNTYRNFNSLQEYMNYYNLHFGLYVLASTLVVFFVIELLLTGVPALCAVIVNKREKKKPEEASQSEETVLQLQDNTSHQEEISQQTSDYYQ